MKPLNVGDVFTCERTFTVEDVQDLARVSQDDSILHRPDAEGRLLVHGLLVATLPARLAGSLNLFAREMSLSFVRPVFTGDRIECHLEIAETEPLEDRVNVACALVCRNQHGKEVLSGTCRGVIPR